MVQFSSEEVDGALAQKLIVYGTEQVFGDGRDSDPAYCTLLEGMQNTIDHAHYTSDGKVASLGALKTEKWWASVYADRQRSRVCFALLDVGVGILKSAKIKALRRIDRLLRMAADAEILSDILDGKLQSRTGLENRGKGLPSIKRLSDSGDIKNLTLVSNSVHARVSDNEFGSMPEPFSGTLLYWEIDK
jgi:hypothetical protein